MKKNSFMICTLLFVIAVFMPFIVHAESNPSVYELIDNDKGIIYAKDAEDNDLGISDYSIDDNLIYLLSNVHNDIYVYRDGNRINEVNFDRFNFKIIRFAVDGNRVWIYDNKSRIVLFENWEEKASLSIYDFADFEAIENFLVIDSELYITIPAYATKDYLTYRIIVSDDQLKCAEVLPGKIIQRGMIQNTEEVRKKLSSVTAIIAERDGYQFEAQQGVSDIGEAKDGCHYYLSREILDDGKKEYYLQRVYCFDSEENLKTVFNIPAMIPTCGEEVRLINGIVYLLATEQKSVILDTLENTCTRALSDCMREINWSRFSYENSSSDQNASNNSSLLTSPSYVTRASCISRIQSYCESFTWSCSAANLQPLTGWLCPHYVNGAGSYNSVPYCWGGFDTLTGYTTNIQNGYRVGNIDTSNSDYVNFTAGVDCSGLVSRALALPYYCTTSGLPSITTNIVWSNIQMSDLILRPGHHVMMYYFTTPSGHFWVYESTTFSSYDRCIGIVHFSGTLPFYSVYTYPGFTG